LPSGVDIWPVQVPVISVAAKTDFAPKTVNNAAQRTSQYLSCFILEAPSGGFMRRADDIGREGSATTCGEKRIPYGNDRKKSRWRLALVRLKEKQRQGSLRCARPRRAPVEMTELLERETASFLLAAAVSDSERLMR
jgi:hypothetical protein